MTSIREQKTQKIISLDDSLTPQIKAKRFEILPLSLDIEKISTLTSIRLVVGMRIFHLTNKNSATVIGFGKDYILDFAKKYLWKTYCTEENCFKTMKEYILYATLSY